LDIESCKIQRSGFDFTSNLTSTIGNLANHGFLASYVSRHKAMAYDTPQPSCSRRAAAAATVEPPAKLPLPSCRRRHAAAKLPLPPPSCHCC
jgi:hypothetical protein